MRDDLTTSQVRGRPPSRRIATMLATMVAAGVVMSGSALLAFADSTTQPGSGGSPPPCEPISEGSPGQPPELKPTTITTVQQAYECIFAHQYGGSRLDDRVLLTGGFKAFTAELQRRGLDQGTATLPRLVGDHRRDWAAFARTYLRLLSALPEDPDLRQALAAATINGMIEALHENHIGWVRNEGRSAPTPKLGIETTFEGLPVMDVPPKDVRDATGPMYVDAVWPRSPAAEAGLKRGDIIEAVNQVPVFIEGKLTPGVLEWLDPKSSDPVTIAVRRPATDEAWSVELRPANVSPPGPPPVSGRLLDGGVAYVTVPTFAPAAAERVLAKIAELRVDSQVEGVILDLRGNGGGSPVEVARLLGAFAHGKIWSWDCDARNRCSPNRTDDTVPLLQLPLVGLTDGRCASACDAFSAAVKDLRLGSLVGARTAGVVAAVPDAYRLEDNSLLALNATHQVAANGEIINDIGVAADYQAPLTARDVSTGSDPAVDKALSLLRG